ncbi:MULTISPECIES: hypothetical protein [unclassified Methylomonas]|uniref:hypothetical protein n=1 Tax=unclassified Methylomonas TaxID=2608980 RepID=UPI0008D907AC|nr:MULTISPECIES: hypothetical protein [unclassified Methylomonas]NJA07490.1 hypothetical protein [Methylococcaceae bacterium WWC4]OHX35970.1 hypothetical protein BJL95_02710 [Methylomonas sp. LWB]WGS87366.1 hypothetical protein QC632_06330 [Methylomonas sp. UP202]
MQHKLFKQSASATLAALLAGPFGAASAGTLSVDSVADTYLNSDPVLSNRDWSNFGAMGISANLANPAKGMTTPRTMDALIAYDTAAIKSGFDAEFGAGNWHVTDVKVKWYSNYDILGVAPTNPQLNVPAAGAFHISLLTDNGWFDAASAGDKGFANTDLNWDSVFGAGGKYGKLLDGAQVLGTYSYGGGNFNGGNNCLNEVCAPRFWDLGANADLYDSIANGGFVSLFGSAADSNVSYIVSQRSAAGAHPQLFVSAAAGVAAVPLPAGLSLFLSGGLSLLGIGRRRGPLVPSKVQVGPAHNAPTLWANEKSRSPFDKALPSAAEGLRTNGVLYRPTALSRIISNTLERCS